MMDFQKITCAFLVVLLLDQTTAICKQNVQFISENNTYYEPCSVTTELSSTSGGSGTGVEMKERQMLECCKNYTYSGAGAALYEYNGTCPVYLELFITNLPEGTTVTIKNIFNQEDNKCYVFSFTSNSNDYLNLPVSQSRFTITSGKDAVDVTFRVNNEECSSCSAGCEDNWTEFKGKCYHVNPEFETWEWHRNKCEEQGGYLMSMERPEDLDFMRGLNAPMTWIGLYLNDNSDTVWKWVRPNGLNVPLDITLGVWDPGMPLMGVQRLCGETNMFGDMITNTGCATKNPAICCKPKQL